MAEKKQKEPLSAKAIEDKLLSKGVRSLEKRLSKLYARIRKRHGHKVTPHLTLAFRDTNKAKAAKFLHARAQKDKALAEALDALLHGGTSAPPRAAMPPPPYRAPKRSRTPTPPGSPRSGRLSRLDMLLIGVTDPRREKTEDLKAFLRTVLERKEAGAGAISRVIDSNADHGALATLAERFLEPPLETRQARVKEILTKSPDKEAAVVRVLARSIRANQEIDQQFINANAQLSKALQEALKTMTLEPGERKRIQDGIKRLDATRTLAVRDTNESLLAAKKAVAALST